MSRLAAIAALAVLVAGCADPATSPTSLRPSGPSFDAGTAPPPRVSGGGSATLTVTPTDAAGLTVQGAAPTGNLPPGPACMAHTLTFQFTSEYFENKPNTNQRLTIRQADGSQVTIHEKPNGMIDAHGTIMGSDFTFKITDAPAGILQGFRSTEGGGVGGYFNVEVRGIITDALGSCNGMGSLNGSFSEFFGGGGVIGGPGL
ncbi:MAG: hypothetical protein ACR2OG_14060 [Gemmatimonadaceae bacterium]